MRVYADNAATTKLSPAAKEAMLPYFDEIYGNPSTLYTLGQEAAEQVTVLNLKVVKVDKEKGVLLIKGAIPGPKGSVVYVRDAVKKS